MPDTEANARPDNFANAPLDEAVGRLVAIIRREQPQVLITYGDERAFYKHPDHIRVHEISVPAFEAAGDPDRYPDAGEPWQPSKLYYSGFSFRRIRRCTTRTSSCGEESPYAERIAQFTAAGGPTDRRRSRHRPRSSTSATTSRPRRAALLAHRTQIDPDSHWMRVPDDLMRDDLPVGGVRAGPIARRVRTDADRRRAGDRSVRGVCARPRRCSAQESARCERGRVPERRVARRRWVGRGAAPGATGTVQSWSPARRRRRQVASRGSTTASWSRPRRATRAAPDLTLTVGYAGRRGDGRG